LPGACRPPATPAGGCGQSSRAPRRCCCRAVSDASSSPSALGRAGPVQGAGSSPSAPQAWSPWDWTERRPRRGRPAEHLAGAAVVRAAMPGACPPVRRRSRPGAGQSPVPHRGRSSRAPCRRRCRASSNAGSVPVPRPAPLGGSQWRWTERRRPRGARCSDGERPLRALPMANTGREATGRFRAMMRRKLPSARFRRHIPHGPASHRLRSVSLYMTVELLRKSRERDGKRSRSPATSVSPLRCGPGSLASFRQWRATIEFSWCPLSVGLSSMILIVHPSTWPFHWRFAEAIQCAKALEARLIPDRRSTLVTGLLTTDLPSRSRARRARIPEWGSRASLRPLLSPERASPQD
jgi:hypothetical protein